MTEYLKLRAQTATPGVLLTLLEFTFRQGYWGLPHVLFVLT